ncbi:hypothetical protein VR7878_00850 [Vibrio ruber DSM 16370]|uniref:Putative auto-transporter adhesin head GIN domain-containing protein n=1 Tax=Vibrio ruber (strain DSM 16370 / JCM 11486 / BCRC 17186 / CECT 7878 / LMG 23124 / VR1) TaxID=1123498 RepID=A0A1R4LDH3_VIBR1|nr:DUF2807 domain-containing protein [Vibrio ruber]SJN54616.1 hypothetical protein VR7878_00850 [Vibrio ruber DSM 16370]
MKLKTTVSTAIFSVVMSSPLYAAEQTFPVDSFNQLVLLKGMSAEVVCSSTPQVVASGKQYLLDKLQLGVTDNELSLVNEGYRDEGLWPDKLTVEIYTDQPLKSVEAQFGVAVTAGDCALADNQLAVKGAMGASYELKGNVNTLDLDVSMGASFNEDVNDFYAQKANVTVAMGAQANLCHVDTVNGSASMGARVILGQQTQSHLSFSMGGYSTRSDCQ